MRRSWIVFLVLLVLAWARPALADEAARHHALALEHARAERFDRAAQAFLEEHRLTGRAGLLFNVAECYRSHYKQTRDARELHLAERYYAGFLAAEPAGAFSERAREARRLIQARLAELEGARPRPLDLSARSAPVSAPIVSPPPAPGVTPTYKRWWVWAAVGAVAAGTVVAIVATRGGGVDAPPSDFMVMPY